MTMSRHETSATGTEPEEIGELRKKLERVRAAGVTHRRERAEIEGRLIDTERRLAEQGVELEQERRTVSALREEREAFVAYADKLEQMYLRLVRSRSWRTMGPVRVVGRAVKRALGGASSGRSRLPKRPRQADSGGDATPEPTPVAGTADYIARLLKKSEFDKVFALKRKLEMALVTEEGDLGHAFLMVTLARQTSAFEFGAQAADGVFRRYRGRHAQLRGMFGGQGYQRFITDAAYNYTRVGRYVDAKELLDVAIAAGSTELLPIRAEILWIHDPDQAARDLATSMEVSGAGRRTGDARLYRHLMLNVLDNPEVTMTSEESTGELLLVDAIRALDDGRFDDYRRLVNRYFEEQGLAGPIPDDANAFSFDHLVAPPETSSVDDGPLVSVIMTAFDAEATVECAVGSILQQTYRNIEVIVVDDRSSDGTLDLLDKIEQGDPRVTVIRRETNAGTYVARNRALEVAAGAYLTFHDSDDWAHPLRIQAHLEAMAADPELVATRSMCLRVDGRGQIDFRRWQKKLAHPNGVSVFMKREALDTVGFFDRVRFSADSEYWFRLQRVFGRNAVRAIPACLGLARQHEASLTRSGAGARDVENYSAVRSAYQHSWFEWHARLPTAELYVKNSSAERPFWAPPEMVAEPSTNSGPSSLAQVYPADSAGGVPNVVFGVSFAAKEASGDWGVTQKLLGRTLRSVIHQSDGRWRVVVCGHDRPELPELDDPRIIFVEAGTTPPSNPGNYRKDKMAKRRMAGSVLRDLGGGYFFPLDADDLVHRDVVKQVQEDNNQRGYRAERGYVEDFANQRLAPVPGAWSASFDRVCGSSAVLFFEPDELPAGSQSDPGLYFNLFQKHAYSPVIAEEWGRGLTDLPFPGAVYVVNHSQNLSFGLQRAGVRTQNIIGAIERHAMDNGADVLRDDFGQI